MTERELRLLDVARDAMRFLDYKTSHSEARILIGRHLHNVLLEYDDIEPLNDADKIEWRKRREATVLAGDPRR